MLPHMRSCLLISYFPLNQTIFYGTLLRTHYLYSRLPSYSFLAPYTARPGPLRRKTDNNNNSKSVNLISPLSANPRKTGSSHIEDNYIYNSVPITITFQISNIFDCKPFPKIKYNCTFQISNIFDREAFSRKAKNKETQKLNSKTFILYMPKLNQQPRQTRLC